MLIERGPRRQWDPMPDERRQLLFYPKLLFLPGRSVQTWSLVTSLLDFLEIWQNSGKHFLDKKLLSCYSLQWRHMRLWRFQLSTNRHERHKNQRRPFVSGVQQSPVDYYHKGPLMRKRFHISMTSYHWKKTHKTCLRGRSSPKEMNKKIARHQVARCYVDNEDVVWAAPTGDAPTTSELSTIILPTKVRLILEIWW